MSTTKENYYIGVDVGTGSVRVSLFSSNGRRVASNEQRIETWRSSSDHRIFEQSTENIWTCICSAIRECLSSTAIEKEEVKGVGFDATCSLAVTDFNGKPISVSSGQDIGTIGERNVVLWADHRAEKEAEVINATGSVVLDYVGGKMSVGSRCSYNLIYLCLICSNSWKWRFQRSSGLKIICHPNVFPSVNSLTFPTFSPTKLHKMHLGQHARLPANVRMFPILGGKKSSSIRLGSESWWTEVSHQLAPEEQKRCYMRECLWEKG